MEHGPEEGTLCTGWAWDGEQNLLGRQERGSGRGVRGVE